MLNYFAILGISLVFIVLYGRVLFIFLQEKRAREKAKAFEKAVAGKGNPADAEKFFTGEFKLEKTIYVVMPTGVDEETLYSRFAGPIDEAIRDRNVGIVERAYAIEGTSGFDIQLTDFVAGLELVVAILTENAAPDDTVIEYDNIELPLFDM